MAKFEIFGKDRLGEAGFCLSTAKIAEKGRDMKNNIRNIYDSVRVEKKYDFIMTSMTSAEDIMQQGGSYLPAIVTYDASLDPVFNPIKMFETKERGERLPIADFFVWSRCFNLKVATFSRTAPIIYLESKADGYSDTCCFGTLLKKPIFDHGEYIFKKLISAITREVEEGVESKIFCRVVTCTDYEYPETGTIFSKIKSILEGLGVSDVELMYAVDRNKDFLYQHDDFGNHVVVVS